MNYRHRVAILLAILACALGASAQDLQRGFRNYHEIVGGRKKLEQLTPQEQQEVLLVARRLRAAQSKSGKSSACRDAIERAESTSSELADRARKLRNCAEAQDFSDDCDTELRRVRSAHSDYEDAVSSVRSECD
jgi:hypothetical protein